MRLRSLLPLVLAIAATACNSPTPPDARLVEASLDQETHYVESWQQELGMVLVKIDIVNHSSQTATVRGLTLSISRSTRPAIKMSGFSPALMTTDDLQFLRSGAFADWDADYEALTLKIEPGQKRTIEAMCAYPPSAVPGDTVQFGLISEKLEPLRGSLADQGDFTARMGKPLGGKIIFR